MNHYERKRAQRVYYAARGMGLSHEGAEDMAQEYHIAFLENRSKFQSAKHFVIDQLRLQGYAKYRGGPSIFDTQHAITIEPSEWSHPENIVRLEEALKHHSLEQRVILVLKNLWGFNAEEIGFVVGLPGWRVLHILKKLQ